MPVANLKQFQNGMKIAAKTPERMLVRHQKMLGLEGLRRVVLRTPVDTGRARGNWQLTIGEPADSIIEEIRDPSTVITAGAQELRALEAFTVIFITNNVPYIIALEGGHSTQAPRGMIGLTLQELSQVNFA